VGKRRSPTGPARDVRGQVLATPADRRDPAVPAAIQPLGGLALPVHTVLLDVCAGGHPYPRRAARRRARLTPHTALPTAVCRRTRPGPGTTRGATPVALTPPSTARAPAASRRCAGWQRTDPNRGGHLQVRRRDPACRCAGVAVQPGALQRRCAAGQAPGRAGSNSKHPDRCRLGAVHQHSIGRAAIVLATRRRHPHAGPGHSDNPDAHAHAGTMSQSSDPCAGARRLYARTPHR